MGLPSRSGGTPPCQAVHYVQPMVPLQREAAGDVRAGEGALEPWSSREGHREVPPAPAVQTHGSGAPKGGRGNASDFVGSSVLRTQCTIGRLTDPRKRFPLPRRYQSWGLVQPLPDNGGLRKPIRRRAATLARAAGNSDRRGRQGCKPHPLVLARGRGITSPGSMQQPPTCIPFSVWPSQTNRRWVETCPDSACPLGLRRRYQFRAVTIQRATAG